MTLDNHFDSFIADVYPDQPESGSEQRKQLRDAFFAGCLVAYTAEEDFAAELLRESQAVHDRARKVQ